MGIATIVKPHTLYGKLNSTLEKILNGQNPSRGSEIILILVNLPQTAWKSSFQSEMCQCIAKSKMALVFIYLVFLIKRD